MQKGDSGIHSQMSSLSCSKVTDLMKGCLGNLSAFGEPGRQVNTNHLKNWSGRSTIFLHVMQIN